MSSRALLVLVAVLSLSRPALASDEAPGQVYPGPFDRMARNFADGFLGMNLAFHIVAVGATSVLTTQDVDGEAHRYFRDHPRWGRNVYPIVVAGVVGPVALFGGLHVAGRAMRSPDTVGAAYAVFQAAALTLGYVTVLKLVTGRPAPNENNIPALAEDDAQLSRTFRPGIYRGGVVAGWPSGHVAVTTAVLSSLVGYYPDNPWLKLALLVGSASMMIGVSSFEAGSMHWCSDAVAGALMALPIGLSTGRGMRAVVSGRRLQQASAWFFVPSLRPEVSGATIGRRF